MSDHNADQYRIDEMKSLRAEINIQLQEMYRLENFAILAIAGVASILFLSDPARVGAIGRYLAFVPVVAVVYCWVRARSIRSLIGTMDEYIMALEARLPTVSMKDGSGAFTGWVQFYLTKPRVYTKLENVFWLTLLAAAAGLVGLYFHVPIVSQKL